MAASTAEGRANGSSADPFLSAEDDRVPDDPPPAYEASPANNNEQTVELGPARPFQPPPGAPPPRHPSSGLQPQPAGASSSSGSGGARPGPANLSAPQYPFWNGAHLTPQQTGFSEGPPDRGQAPQGYAPPQVAHPQPHRPPQDDEPRHYAPTSTPTPGQPLLNDNRLLVYPKNHVCGKCKNTGYKDNDPGHPCKKCWSKYGKPYTNALRFAPSETPAQNFQRPWRPRPQRQQRPPGAAGFPGSQSSSYGMPVGSPPGGYGAPGPWPAWGTPGMPSWGPAAGPRMPLVVSPGDPRIGGALCPYCGGDGLITVSWFWGTEETCGACHGAGRLF